jgi:conjugal transfer pilus assembly protein TraW
VLVAWCLQAQGQQSLSDGEWLEQSRRRLEEAAAGEAPAWLRIEPDEAHRAMAQDIAAASIGQPTRAPETQASAGQVWIFGSFSLPRPTLTQLLKEASEPGVVLVLRGVPAKATVPATIRRLQTFLPNSERVPNVILDPALFRRFDVQRVPTLVLSRAQGLRPVIVQGAVSVAWLRRMASALTTGGEHLGKRAEDFEIAETDLIEEMQRRLAAIDWTARRERAASAFWPRLRSTFVRLPQTEQPRQVIVNPTVRVTQDVTDAEGHVLIAAGETFNPLNLVPLSKTLIVFQGTSPPQVRTAMSLAQAVRERGRGVILLTTDVDTARGWSHLAQLEQAFEAAVYLLPQALVERFQIKRVPATIVAQGAALVITEVPVRETL